MLGTLLCAVHMLKMCKIESNQQKLNPIMMKVVMHQGERDASQVTHHPERARHEDQVNECVMM
jgi:hypothetical protein